MNEETKELNEIEFEQPLEEEIESIEVPPSKRKVYTDQGDPEVESLHGKYKRGKLIIQPDFQRHFVWDAQKSSRLIESALLDIPLPLLESFGTFKGNITIENIRLNQLILQY